MHDLQDELLEKGVVSRRHTRTKLETNRLRGRGRKSFGGATQPGRVANEVDASESTICDLLDSGPFGRRRREEGQIDAHPVDFGWRRGAPEPRAIRSNVSPPPLAMKLPGKSLATKTSGTRFACESDFEDPSITHVTVFGSEYVSF